MEDYKDHQDKADEEFHPEDFDQLNIIKLEDDEGREVEFEYLGEVKLAGKNFLVMSLVEDDNEDDAESVVIFEVEGNEKEGEFYRPVEDETLMESVFELFKEENKDDFDFQD